jgi:hypothetical protein
MAQNVVHVPQWHGKPSPRHRQATDFTQALYHLETDLRAAGFLVAADLVAAGGLAVWQDARREPERN